jgi:hypothetical protein
MGSPTTLAEYGEKYRIRMKRDECGDSIVGGRFGHLYEQYAGRFGIVLELPADGTRLDNTLRSRKRRALAAGFVLHQEGECEAILLFDPSDRKQAALAIRLIQAKKIRKAPRPTDAQRRARALFSFKARSRRPCFDQNTGSVVG